MVSASSPAAQLAGLKLTALRGDIWEVVGPVVPEQGATGSNFSVGYLVRLIQKASGTPVTGGAEAFCKAMDFGRALGMPDPAQALADLTNIFLFERSILEHCRDRDLRRVSRYLDTGTVSIPTVPPPVNVVQYIIFEKAEGDIRSSLSRSKLVDWAWKMRCLQHLTTGVEQMHANDLVHQDIKPSNLLECNSGGHKLADLGRASRRNHSGPFDGMSFAGDPGYAPPESSYDQCSSRNHSGHGPSSCLSRSTLLLDYFFGRQSKPPRRYRSSKDGKITTSRGTRLPEGGTFGTR